VVTSAVYKIIWEKDQTDDGLISFPESGNFYFCRKIDDARRAIDRMVDTSLRKIQTKANIFSRVTSTPSASLEGHTYFAAFFTFSGAFSMA